MSESHGSAMRLTPAGIGGLHVFGLLGGDLDAFLDRHFVPIAGRKEGATLEFGRLVDDGEVIDEVLVHRSPECAGDRLEISVHGSVAVERRVTAILASSGFAIGGNVSEFSCMNSGELRRGPAIATELMQAIRDAGSPCAVKFFLRSLDGMLVREVDGILALLARGHRPHAAITATARITSLLERSPLGLGLTTPPTVSITGPVNAGKSTLFNRLLGRERAIVSPIAGTTRDVNVLPLIVGGWPFRIADTAGWRETSEEIERIGMLRGREWTNRATIVFELHDLEALGEAAIDLGPQSVGARVVVTKVDAVSEHLRERLRHARPDILQCSTKADLGIDVIERTMVRCSPFAAPASMVFAAPFTIRQVRLLEAARDAAFDEQGDRALTALQELLGSAPVEHGHT